MFTWLIIIVDYDIIIIILIKILSVTYYFDVYL